MHIISFIYVIMPSKFREPSPQPMHASCVRVRTESELPTSLPFVFRSLPMHPGRWSILVVLRPF